VKVVILAGGMGTRLREETEYRPKPMAEIGGRPILWHIMKTYAYHGFCEFIICLGYKGDVVRDYFLNYEIRNRDFTVTLGSRRLEVHGNHSETGWKVTLADTGLNTMTGGRIKRIARYLGNQTFMATYGDGVADVNIESLLAFHRQRGRLATVTGVRPSSRYGELQVQDDFAFKVLVPPTASDRPYRPLVMLDALLAEAVTLLVLAVAILLRDADAGAVCGQARGVSISKRT
jgi:glucose-1-phosphate cytidylyltransferase